MAKNLVVGKEKVGKKAYTIILNENKLFMVDEKLKIKSGTRIPGVSADAIAAGTPAFGMYSACLSFLYKLNGMDYKTEKAKAEKKAAKKEKVEKKEKKSKKEKVEKKDKTKDKKKKKK